METVPMTSGGYDALDTELKRLKGPERRRIIKAISEARIRMVICRKMPNITPPRTTEP